MDARWIVRTVAGVFLLGMLAGCAERSGAGSNTTGDPNRQETTQRSTDSNAEEAVITAANRDAFSEDAVVLAIREARGVKVSAEAAERFDKDLELIRKGYPRLAGIDARPAFVMDEMLVGLRDDTSWRERWRDGEIQTGEADVDRLLREYDANGVEPLLPPGEMTEDTNLQVFVMSFGSPLNVDAGARELEASSDGFRYAEPNSIAGDGDDIVFERGAGERREYIFSEGSGDCASGCIERRSWTVRLGGDGSVSIEASGDGGGGGATEPENNTY